MKILHLYYDLMNLYGEYGNIACMERYLSMEGIEAQTDRLSLFDEIDFTQYDFIYIGSGTEKNQLLALEDMLKRKSEILSAIENGTVFLATGNAFELFGSKLILTDSEEKKCLGAFDFYTKIDTSKRTTADTVCQFTVDGSECVGFINKASETFGITTPMFNVIYGEGNNCTEKGEGFINGKFYGTHLIAPCLVKNPYLAQYFVKLLCEKSGKEYQGLSLPYETKTYEVTLRELKKRFA